MRATFPPSYGDVTAFSLLALLVWPQPVSFQSTSVPSGVFPSFRFPQALRASVPLEQSQMPSLVSGPWAGRPVLTLLGRGRVGDSGPLPALWGFLGSCGRGRSCGV